MDTLALKGMKFHAYHGFYDHEKKEGNDFEVDILLTANLNRASLSDELDETIDYAGIRELTESVMTGESVNLIEHLAAKIGTQITQDYPWIKKVEVRIRKLNPPMPGHTAYTEVRMSWPRS